MTSDARTVSKLLSGPEYNWVGEERDNYCVSYTNNSSIGNRYVNWHGLWVYKTIDEEKTPKGKVVDVESAHDLIKEYDWRCVFSFIEYGIFVGPATQEALMDCVKLIESTELSEEGGRLHRTWNGMTYVYVTKRTQETWSLQGKVRSRMLEGLRADRAEKKLLSDDWVYMSHGHSGWSRSC